MGIKYGWNRLKLGWGEEVFFDLTQDYFKTWGITQNKSEKGDGEQDTYIF